MTMHVRRSGRLLSYKGVFALCWMSYLTAYLCRVNFSVAMGAMSGELGLSADRLGMVGAVFFSVYAAGQLVNGFLGDRVRPAGFLLFSLSGMALCNLAVGLWKSFPGILIFWGLNGYFQSIVWSVIIRILAGAVPPCRRAAASTFISTSIAGGYFVSWSLLGQWLDGHGYALYFLIPTAPALFMAAAWFAVSRKAGVDARPEGRIPQRSVKDTVRFIRREKLYLVCAVCVLHGLIKEGIAFWFPSLIHDILVLPDASPVLALAVIPAANLAGMFLSRRLLQKSRLSTPAILAGTFALMALACAAVWQTGGGALSIGLIAMVSCLSYALNTIIMAFLPMQYAGENMVASLTGIFDCASYAGAAVSAYALGRQITSGGLSFTAAVWMAAGLLAAGASLVLLCKTRKQTGKEHFCEQPSANASGLGGHVACGAEDRRVHPGKSRRGGQ